MKTLTSILDSDAFRREFLKANSTGEAVIKGNADIESSSAWTYADVAQVEGDLKWFPCESRM